MYKDDPMRRFAPSGKIIATSAIFAFAQRTSEYLGMHWLM